MIKNYHFSDGDEPIRDQFRAGQNSCTNNFWNRQINIPKRWFSRLLSRICCVTLRLCTKQCTLVGTLYDLSRYNFQYYFNVNIQKKLPEKFCSLINVDFLFFFYRGVNKSTAILGVTSFHPGCGRHIWRLHDNNYNEPLGCRKGSITGAKFG